MLDLVAQVAVPDKIGIATFAGFVFIEIPVRDGKAVRRPCTSGGRLRQADMLSIFRQLFKSTRKERHEATPMGVWRYSWRPRCLFYSQRPQEPASFEWLGNPAVLVQIMRTSPRGKHCQYGKSLGCDREGSGRRTGVGGEVLFIENSKSSPIRL